MKTRLICICLLSLFLTSSYFEFNPPKGMLDLGSLFNYANQWFPDKAEYRWNEKNPVSDIGATLGRALFYDKQLSVNNTISCASCHQQEHAFGDPRKVSIGFNGQPTERHAMRLVNVDFHVDGNRFWDERVFTLENLATLPIKNEIEMGFSGKDGFPAIDSLLRKMSHLDYYQPLFKEVYGDTIITEERIALALAQFTRSIITFDSKFDEGFEAVGGNEKIDFPNYTEEENRGKLLFFNPPAGIFNGRENVDSILFGTGCGFCHKAPGFDIIHLSQNNGVIGVAGDSTAVDLTIHRSPSLKNLVKPDGTPNGPFMHDGSLQTLEDVVEHYNLIPFDPRNPLNTSLLFAMNNGNVELQLEEREKADLIAFLKTLSGEDLYTNEKWSNPFDENGNLRITNSSICNTVVKEMAVTICEGDNFEGLTQAGIYADTFFLSTFCDSIRVLNLTVFPTPTTSEVIQICAGESFNGFTESGIYESRKRATSGCDTLHTLTLEVLEADNSACLSTSTTQLSIAKAKIYPNPTSTSISFQNVPANRYTLSLINNAGIEVYSRVLDITEGSTLNVAWLSEGMYFLQLVDIKTMDHYQFKFLKIE